MSEQTLVILIAVGVGIFYLISWLKPHFAQPKQKSEANTWRLSLDYGRYAVNVLRQNKWLFLIPFCIADLGFILKLPNWIQYHSIILTPHFKSGLGILELVAASPYAGGKLWQSFQFDVGFYSAFLQIFKLIFNLPILLILSKSDPISIKQPPIALQVFGYITLAVTFAAVVLAEGIMLGVIQRVLQGKKVHRSEFIPFAKMFFVKLFIINVFLETGKFLLLLLSEYLILSSGFIGFYQLRVFLPNVFSLFFYVAPFAVLLENNLLSALRHMLTIIKNNLLTYCVFLLTGSLVMFLLSFTTFLLYLLIPAWSYPALGIEFIVMTLRVGVAVVFSLGMFKWYLDKHTSIQPA